MTSVTAAPSPLAHVLTAGRQPSSRGAGGVWPASGGQADSTRLRADEPPGGLRAEGERR